MNTHYLVVYVCVCVFVFVCVCVFVCMCVCIYVCVLSDPRIMYICSMMLCDTMLCIGLLSNYIFRSVDVNIDIVQLSRCIIGFNDIM